MSGSDKRREDLIVPYVHKPEEKGKSGTSMMSQSMPMAAMFMKSKLLAWCGLLSSIQTYLNEPEFPASDATPAWMAVSTAILSLCVTYMDFVFHRPVPPRPGGQPAPQASAT